MRKIVGLVLSVAILVGLGLSDVHAQGMEMKEVQRLADTPSKYGFKGLYTLYSPDTYPKGKFGIGVYWDITRFCLPGDPRYPQVQEFTLGGAYGITDKLEVGIAAPFRSLNVPAADTVGRGPSDPGIKERSESGFSNLSVGLRYNLIKQEEGFEVTPYIQAFLPTAQDPKKGLGADVTRIHFGFSAGTLLGAARLYTQVAYQLAPSLDINSRNFTERTAWDPSTLPRFAEDDRFGTNPLFHEYGNTLFYGAGLAIPVVEDTAEIFGEFQFYHSFDEPDTIPLFEDYNTAGHYEPLDVVQDGGMANVGLKFGFGNGLALTAGWGGILFAEEPMYESATWRAFAGLTYNSLRQVAVGPPPPPPPGAERPEDTDEAKLPEYEEIVEECFDCRTAELLMVHFEFDKSTLTPEGIETLKKLGKLLRVCNNLVVEVQGHTDWIGTENYNMGLGNRRARAVVYYLVYDEGIDPARIVKPEKLQKGIIAGETYGESVPIATNETDAGRALNRRGQLVKLVEDTQVICP